MTTTARNIYNRKSPSTFIEQTTYVETDLTWPHHSLSEMKPGEEVYFKGILETENIPRYNVEQIREYLEEKD